MMFTIFQYLSQQGPHAVKHKTWKHPVTVCLVHYAVSITLVLSFHDALVVVRPSSSKTTTTTTTVKGIQQTNLLIANFVLGYFVILLSYRILQNRGNDIMQKACIYENTWLCNMTLLMGSIGLYTGREIMVMAHVITVSIDQVLWYLDLLGWLLLRKFPIGVAKYLTWPQTSFATRITCTHHLWTIPVLLFACIAENAATTTAAADDDYNDDHSNNNIVLLPQDATLMQRLDHAWFNAYTMSAFIMSLNVLLSRWMTPSCIKGEMVATTTATAATVTTTASSFSSTICKEKVQLEKYLNVNLSHALWKDIKFQCLQIQWDNPSTRVYLFRLLWRWQLFNGIVLICVLRPLTRLFVHGWNQEMVK